MNKIKFHYSTIIIFLALYVPFEVVILKYMPVNDKIYSLMRFIPEVVIYLLLLLIIAHKLFHRKWLSRTPIDIPLLLFVLSAVISIIINSAPLGLSIIGMRPLLRYIVLFYIVSNIDIPESKIKFLIIGLICIGGLQSVLTSIQHFIGVSGVFIPRATDLEVEGVQSQFKLVQTGFGSGREQGAGIGTFGDSVLAALFLVFINVISFSYLLRINVKSFAYKICLLGIFLLTFVALFYTYSRASVLISIAAVPVILLLEKRMKKLFFIGITAAIVFAGVLFLMSNESSTGQSYYNPKNKYTNPLDNITNIFSQSYVQNNLEHSRGWIIVEVALPVMQSLKVFGYGPSGDESLGRMVKDNISGTMPFQNLGIINDVYWVALLTYYGVVGIVLFLFILWRLYKVAMFVYKHSPSNIYIIAGLAMVAVVIVAIPYTFILRTFAFRPFAFYFWLLAGIVAAEYRRLKTTQIENNRL